MPLPKSLNSYFDIQRALEAARTVGGGLVQCNSRGAATRWRQRAYYYRKLLAHNQVAKHPHILGFQSTTEWDDMHLTLEGNNVRIAFGNFGFSLVGPDGQVLAMDVARPEPSSPDSEVKLDLNDPLVAMALELAEKGPIPR